MPLSTVSTLFRKHICNPTKPLRACPLIRTPPTRSLVRNGPRHGNDATQARTLLPKVSNTAGATATALGRHDCTRTARPGSPGTTRRAASSGTPGGSGQEQHGVAPPGAGTPTSGRWPPSPCRGPRWRARSRFSKPTGISPCARGWWTTCSSRHPSPRTRVPDPRSSGSPRALTGAPPSSQPPAGRQAATGAVAWSQSPSASAVAGGESSTARACRRAGMSCSRSRSRTVSARHAAVSRSDRPWSAKKQPVVPAAAADWPGRAGRSRASTAQYERYGDAGGDGAVREGVRAVGLGGGLGEVERVEFGQHEGVQEGGHIPRPGGRDRRRPGGAGPSRSRPSRRPRLRPVRGGHLRACGLRPALPARPGPRRSGRCSP